MGLQDLNGATVILPVAVSRHEQRAVYEVEVHIRRRQSLAVVLDIRLPRMDGWEVLTRLKADPVTRSIPVVVVSIVDERQRGLRLGAAAYLLKPVRREDLLEALDVPGLGAGLDPVGGGVS